MLEKIIVFGLGKDFLEKKEQILTRYKVIAYTDNHHSSEEKESFIYPDRIKEMEFDKVLICTRKYKDAIKCQLVGIGIDERKIIDLSVLEKRDTSDFKEILNDIALYNKRNHDTGFEIKENSLQIIITDKYDNAGTIDRHYFAQDIWAAKKILKASPKEHYDIGSRLEGFISHLLVFRDVNYIDIRPLPNYIPGLNFVQSDATNLEGIEDNSIQSLSSLHAIEHFGLGRYGDEIDPYAYIKVIKNIQRVMAPKGHVYIGVPVGATDKLVFNAHRIFSINTILALFDKMKLLDICIIKDENAYTEEILEKDYGNIPDYSCCLFEFEKDEDL